MEFEEEDVFGQIEWDNLLDGLPVDGGDDDNIFMELESEPPLLHLSDDSPPSSSLDNSSPGNTVSSWIGEIETMLMKEDDNNTAHEGGNCFDDFLADILVDSPPDGSSPGGEVVDASTANTDKDSYSNTDKDSDEKEEEMKGIERDEGAVEEENKNNNSNDDEEEEDPDDPVSKKRRRQLRNRDAAVRSRERKKMYVRDLEIKSRYLEGECRRLDRLLQCFIAENHALRLSLQSGSAFGATSAKQESAVLLLESLLLGSLLWFLGIMCLFTLPAMRQSILLSNLLKNMERKTPENAALRGAGSKKFVPSTNGRRCKASRPRMKLTDAKSFLLFVWFCN